jgi:hypothetical protein
MINFTKGEELALRKLEGVMSFSGVEFFFAFSFIICHFLTNS